jgi:DNA primase
MRFPPSFLDDIRARLPVSQVVSRKVALKKKGREYAGLSPFKIEKTPSFFVNDQKGFYHCFASGEHGDIFKFVMATEGLSFPEAVERLAAEAGLRMPQLSEREAAAEDSRQRLYALLDASAQFFEDCLRGPAGAEARRYIERRGLKRETVAAFRLGFAPPSRSALKEHLGKQGYALDEMIAAGMLIAGDDIPVAYDRFRNRVMFPIGDLRGRTIAFGGRALDAEAPAKYLNSPETPLFHKGHVLFNAHRARGAAHDKGRVIAVEGYMDVAALHEGGFAEAVAPLGTALTEDQVKILWRMSPEPILCFDGDSAGRKAAHRAIDVVLPHLRPGVSVAIAFLPDGLDPDDLIRQHGSAAMEAVLSRTRPLSAVMFEREWGGGDWSTPERRAGLEQQLRALVQRIEDPGVRGHYEQDVRRRLAEAWGGPSSSSRGRDARMPSARGGPGRDGRPQVAYRSDSPWPVASSGGRPTRGGAERRGAPGPPQRPAPSASLLNSGLVSGQSAGQVTAPPYREALLMRTLVNHPWLIDDHAEAIADLALVSPPMGRLRDAILSLQAADNSLDSARLTSQLDKAGLGGVLALLERVITHKCDRFALPNAPNAEVDAGWRHALVLHERQLGLRRALDAAEKSWHDNGSEEALARIIDLQRQLQCLELSGLDATASYGEGL